MNKNMLLAAVSLVAISATAPALAADLAARPYTKAPAMIATVYDWSGFYIGINGGGASATRPGINPRLRWLAAKVPTTRRAARSAVRSAIAGSRHSWVFGVEGQGNWADFRLEQRQRADAASLDQFQDRFFRPASPARSATPGTTSCST